jgi:hypothetical protein
MVPLRGLSQEAFKILSDIVGCVSRRARYGLLAVFFFSSRNLLIVN